MVLVDTVLRKLPGSLGHADSRSRSRSRRRWRAPEYPHYTRPAACRGWDVPEVLLSGHHARIREWRLAQSARRAPGTRYPKARPLRGRCLADPLLAMSSVIDTLERAQLRRVPAFQPGDRVKVHFQVVEGSAAAPRSSRGSCSSARVTACARPSPVRKQSFGVGVERTFPLHSPKIERIEVAARGDVRRAKLYYLRGRVGKRARVRERRDLSPQEAIEPGLLYEEVPGADPRQPARPRPQAAGGQARGRGPRRRRAPPPRAGRRRASPDEAPRLRRRQQ